MILGNDVDIFTVDQKAGYHTLYATVHTATADIAVFKIFSFDVISDFLESYADRVVLKGLIKQSEWVHDVLKNRTNLEMSITKKTSGITYVTRYKAVIPDMTVKQSNVDFTLSLERGELDLGGMAMIELHGKNRFTEVAPLPTLSGTFSNVQLDVVLSKCIKYYMGKTPLPDGPSLDECVIVPSNNQVSYPQITIPTATPLIRLPYFLQKRYGVYTSGIGSYLRIYEDGTKVWWVYPLYGSFKWEDNVPKLSILIPINRTDKRSLAMTNTIQRSGNTIIAVGQLTDSSATVTDDRPIVRPSGFKIVDTEKILQSPSTYKTREVTVSGGDRFKNIKQYSRDDGLPLDIPNTHVSNNYYLASSSVAANMTVPIGIKWENGINELISPGMIVQILYDHVSRGVLRYGRVVGCHSICTSVTKDNASLPLFKETCMLTINAETNQ